MEKMKADENMETEETNSRKISGYAVYRLPYAQECTVMAQTKGEPEALFSVSALGGRSGFVVAPFKPDLRHPVLLLQPDVTMTASPSDLLVGDGSPLAGLLERMVESTFDRPSADPVRDTDKRHYDIDFANFHSHILEGEFSKIVLARCSREERPDGITPIQLFVKACERYPRLFVALVSTKVSGTWLMATPEVLLQGVGERWMTMSLAGTMNLTGKLLDFDMPPSPDKPVDDSEIGWNEKNIQEQRFVSTYITESLEQYATDIVEKGPFTMRAGDLVHLRSDFEFDLPDVNCIGDLLNTLYPTPAVCGLPKESSLDFIVANEFAPRLYYSGFAGPLGMDGHTHLYVSLRCMRVDSDGCSLYAGGGLLADSNMDAEWMETEFKMDTMRTLLKMQ